MRRHQRRMIKMMKEKTVASAMASPKEAMRHKETGSGMGRSGVNTNGNQRKRTGNRRR